MNALLRRFQIPDLLFFSAVICLVSLGLIMVYSSSSIVAYDHYKDSAYFLKRQGVFVVAGITAMFMILSTDYRRWVKAGGWILGASLVTLALVFVPGLGHRINGALRWLSLGGLSFQPAEFAKLACILYMSWALARKGENVRSLTYGLLPMALVAGVLAGLILLQPDFGNAVLIAALAAVLVFLAGCRVSYLISAVLLSLPALFLLVVGSVYRKKRLLAFLDPWSDPHNTSYQIVQSFTAFYSGGMWGTGLGNSSEKLYYLPEVHSDFIGSVIGEELGFLGIALTILCFLFLVFRGYRIALRAPDSMGFLLAAGCSTLIGLQAMLNFAVIMGLVPNKGLPLPFISHGGSALLIMFIACGLIQAVARATELGSSKEIETGN